LEGLTDEELELNYFAKKEIALLNEYIEVFKKAKSENPRSSEAWLKRS